MPTFTFTESIYSTVVCKPYLSTYLPTYQLHLYSTPSDCSGVIQFTHTRREGKMDGWTSLPDLLHTDTRSYLLFTVADSHILEGGEGAGGDLVLEESHRIWIEIIILLQQWSSRTPNRCSLDMYTIFVFWDITLHLHSHAKWDGGGLTPLLSTVSADRPDRVAGADGAAKPYGGRWAFPSTRRAARWRVIVSPAATAKGKSSATWLTRC